MVILIYLFFSAYEGKKKKRSILESEEITLDDGHLIKLEKQASPPPPQKKKKKKKKKNPAAAK